MNSFVSLSLFICDQILENHPYGRAWIFELSMALLIAETTFKNISKLYMY